MRVLQLQIIVERVMMMRRMIVLPIVLVSGVVQPLWMIVAYVLEMDHRVLIVQV